MLPFEGVTVVSLEHAVAAPLATRHLADLGARVIKVERSPNGDFARSYDTTVKGLSSSFAWLNRGKESLVLDLHHEDGRSALARLLSAADVFVWNVAARTMDSLGLGKQSLRSSYPQLISCSITGFGSGGPYSERKAYDLLIQAEAGLLSITGTDEEPCKAGIPVADIAAGMYATQGIVAALYLREKTGKGSSLEVSLFDALAEWMGYPVMYTMYSGRTPQRTGASHATIAPYGPMPLAGGEVVFIAVQQQREWELLCQDVLESPALLADPRFATNELRVANRRHLQDQLASRFRELDAATAIARLDGARIAYSHMNTIREFIDHSQLSSRDRWRDVQSTAGPIRSLLPPIAFEDFQPLMRPIPGLGEHTEAITAEFDLGQTAKFETHGRTSE